MTINKGHTYVEEGPEHLSSLNNFRLDLKWNVGTCIRRIFRGQVGIKIVFTSYQVV